MVCLALELVGPWVVLGFSVGMEAFDELLSINVPWSQEFSGVPRIWTSAYWLWFSVLFLTLGSRLLHLYFTFTFHSHALEKEMATYSSVLAWRIPGTGELGGLPSMGLHRVGHD